MRTYVLATVFDRGNGAGGRSRLTRSPANRWRAKCLTLKYLNLADPPLAPEGDGDPGDAGVASALTALPSGSPEASVDLDGAGVGKRRCGLELLEGQVAARDVDRARVGVVSIEFEDRQGRVDVDSPLVVQIAGEDLARLRHGSGLTTRSAWSPDGTRLAIATRDNSVVIYDPESGEQLGEMDGGLEPIQVV